MSYMVEKSAMEAPAYDVRPAMPKRAAAKALVEASAQNAYMDPDACFKLLELYGIPMAQSAYLAVGGDAKAINVPYPVVAKVDHPEIIHKSDVGGVALNLKNAEELAALLAAWEVKFPGLRGIQVQQQISGDVEMIIGATKDPALGHSILTGLGGTLVELYKDVAFGHVPLSATDPDRMLDSLKCKKLLTGYRGSEPVDVDQFKSIIMAVNELLKDFPVIAEMDINPLIFDRSRGAFFAVDARIKLS